MQKKTVKSWREAAPKGGRQAILNSGAIASHSVLEGILSFFLLFGSTSIIRWVMGPSFVSDNVSGGHWRLLIVGLSVGLLISLLILSRLGRISGGHMNPAISFAMWRFGVFPGRMVLPYVIAQFGGSVAGVLAARYVWGATTEKPPVIFAVLQPAAGWTSAELFAAEAISTGIVIYAVGYFLQSPRLAPLVPWLAGILIGAAIVLLGDVTGASMNPVRQLGPALLSGQYSFLWVYLTAPMVGAFAAAFTLEDARRRSTVLTHRLCGTHEDGSSVSSSREAS
ncbi:MIP/aquaporin family protein [Streptomyces tauricus]|uniref:MIP/aquaporin family protein n=1 Tax=Streptomyces tauricus TaxID=68274 RepID=UPI002243E771|nr:aquaporin [Streptomyces tauricus]MCW8103436.1 aquaporin [Streptomyces tauricus]